MRSVLCRRGMNQMGRGVGKKRTAHVDLLYVEI